MRCKKARRLYFLNHDGMLDESKRMKLEEHINICPECAAFVEEMDRSLGLLSDLAQPEPTENFEWNLKRRILLEKSKMARRIGGNYLNEWQWGVKFIASAAAVSIMVLAGVWYIARDNGPAISDAAGSAGTSSQTTHSRAYIPTRHLSLVDLAGRNGSAAVRNVSNDIAGTGGSYQSQYIMPLESSEKASLDSLAWENELLRRRMESLTRENLLLRKMLSEKQSKR